ncbi:MAG: hypothetical protein II837_08770, partial [Treponema sp.]|nr:hypothetical protein [Treponema sp.]
MTSRIYCCILGIYEDKGYILCIFEKITKGDDVLRKGKLCVAIALALLMLLLHSCKRSFRPTVSYHGCRSTAHSLKF